VAGVVAFDPVDDIAVLRVEGLGAAPLALASEPAAETSGAILGYPENGPLDAQPGRIGRTQEVLTNDVYGRTVRRLLTPLRGIVRPGNSGGPMVGAEGRVLTTVFAGTVSGGPRGGYGVANATVARVLAEGIAHARAGARVSTQACAAG
jgi:S1-C subfamily serine protease